MSLSAIARTVMGMSPGHREAMYQLALSDGDQRRAAEIALAPIPDDWPAHERAVWHGRQVLARQRGRE